MTRIIKLTHLERMVINPAFIPKGTIVYETDTKEMYVLFEEDWVHINTPEEETPIITIV